MCSSLTLNSYFLCVAASRCGISGLVSSVRGPERNFRGFWFNDGWAGIYYRSSPFILMNPQYGEEWYIRLDDGVIDEY